VRAAPARARGRRGARREAAPRQPAPRARRLRTALLIPQGPSSLVPSHSLCSPPQLTHYQGRLSQVGPTDGRLPSKRYVNSRVRRSAVMKRISTVLVIWLAIVGVAVGVALAQGQGGEAAAPPASATAEAQPQDPLFQVASGLFAPLPEVVD